jgi:hypothetical protein
MIVDGRIVSPLAKFITRVTAWTAATLTIATLTVEAQPQPRPAGSSLRNERAFATELQRAFRTGDRQAVASLVRYPARVAVRQRPFPIYIKDRDALEQMFDMVFTPHMRCAVVNSREPVAGEPRPQHTLLLASGVVSLASGRVIAERTQGKYHITRLTSFGDTSTHLTPRPVTFSSEKRSVEFGGRVGEFGADAYVVIARAGDRLRAAISGFPAGSLWLRVSRRGGGTFLDGAADGRGGNGDSAWEARLTEAGEYLVEVVRRAPYCEPPVISHLLSLSLTALESTAPRPASR